jgi:hypothetical protein
MTIIQGEVFIQLDDVSKSEAWDVELHLMKEEAILFRNLRRQGKIHGRSLDAVKDVRKEIDRQRNFDLKETFTFYLEGEFDVDELRWINRALEKSMELLVENRFAVNLHQAIYHERQRILHETYPERKKS